MRPNAHAQWRWARVRTKSAPSLTPDDGWSVWLDAALLTVVEGYVNDAIGFEPN